jgi:acyl-CoA dehydrogenase
MSLSLWSALLLTSFLVLAYLRTSLTGWFIAGAALLFLDTAVVGEPPLLGWLVWGALGIVLWFRPVRRRVLTAPLLTWFRAVLPPMSETERVALEAGTVWWDKELFSGRPDLQALVDYPKPTLSAEERAYIDGPVEELCKVLDDWKITAELNDLSPEAWALIKKHRMFSMIIPKQYGGLEFSALANSTVVMKIASRSLSAAVTVMVPNSLGPGELLMHFGTQAQRDQWLPGLAAGDEIPCFALTSPWAGSDAGAIPDTGVVCKGMHQGKEVLGLRVTWDKRYITLAPVATVLGLAIKVQDPDALLGDKKEMGITCVLMPANTPGVEIGARHLPLNASFMNGPTRGKDVFIPIDWVIGGREQIGNGWKMLVYCLSAGRAISLPALGTSAGKVAARMTGAYARMRKQFRIPISKMEGVEEALTRIAGTTYRMDAMRRLTAASIAQGEKPSVLSAILKYHCTEGMRQVVADAMDVHGGRGVIMGPMNYLARAYQGVPIAITVEGANILTRTLIIFGQGAIRCHPYLLKEMQAAGDADQERGSIAFDQALFAHVGFTISNAVRALVTGLTGAAFVSVPATSHPADRYYRQLSRMSAAFTFVADVGLLLLGGEMKRREKLSGRYGDMLAHLYMMSCVLKHWEDSGRPTGDTPLLEWAAQDSLYRIQDALEGVLQNFPSRPLALLLRLVVLPLGRPYRKPSDRLGRHVAATLTAPSKTRDRLTEHIYLPKDPNDPLGMVERAMELTLKIEPIEAKLAKQKLRLRPGNLERIVEKGLAKGFIDESEAKLLREAHALINRAIAVDEFSPQAAVASTVAPGLKAASNA